MRILIYFRELRFGGVHTYLISHVDYLVRQGHQVWVSYANESTRMIFEGLGACGFNNKELVRSVLRIDKDLIALWKAYRFCRRQRINCVFTHTSKGGAIGRLAGFMAGSPKRIHVVHGFSFHEFTHGYREFLGRKIEQWLALLSTLIISVNESDRERAIRRNICTPDKIKTVFNGIKDPSSDELMTKNEIKRFLKCEGINPQNHVILFVGRLMEQKAPLDLIHAFRGLTRKDAHLILIGEGPLEGECRQLVDRLGLSGKVNLLGFRQDVSKWYQACSLFILPSLWEGLPMTLLEAMSYGACCIATRIKGNRECVSNGVDGILVSPGDPPQLARKIDELMDSEENIRRLGQRAKGTVEKRFSEKRMCEETHRILCS